MCQEEAPKRGLGSTGRGAAKGKLPRRMGILMPLQMSAQGHGSWGGSWMRNEWGGERQGKEASSSTHLALELVSRGSVDGGDLAELLPGKVRAPVRRPRDLAQLHLGASGPHDAALRDGARQALERLELQVKPVLEGLRARLLAVDLPLELLEHGRSTLKHATKQRPR